MKHGNARWRLKLGLACAAVLAALTVYGFTQPRHPPGSVLPEHARSYVMPHTTPLELSAQKAEAFVVTPAEADLLDELSWEEKGIGEKASSTKLSPDLARLALEKNGMLKAAPGCGSMIIPLRI